MLRLGDCACARELHLLGDPAHEEVALSAQLLRVNRDHFRGWSLLVTLHHDRRVAFLHEDRSKLLCEMQCKKVSMALLAENVCRSAARCRAYLMKPKATFDCVVRSAEKHVSLHPLQNNWCAYLSFSAWLVFVWRAFVLKVWSLLFDQQVSLRFSCSEFWCCC